MKAYICIPVPPSSPTNPGLATRILIGVLRRIVPAANPDFDHLYGKVSVWHVEVDAATGQPQREVGLDSAGRVVAIGPWGDNCGVVVDSASALSPADYEQLPPEQFEREWDRFHAASAAAAGSCRDGRQ